jgi:hypothetical protein
VDVEALPDVVLSLDPEEGDAFFTEGPELLFSARIARMPEDAWMTGCQDGLDHASMETASLAGADVVVGELVFADPVLYPDCGTEGYVNLQDGTDEGACSVGPCAVFASPLAVYGTPE